MKLTITLSLISLALLGTLFYQPSHEEALSGSGNGTGVSRFAEMDKDGNVLRIIVAEQSFIDSGAVGEPSNWIKTDYDVPTETTAIGRKVDKKTRTFIKDAKEDQIVSAEVSTSTVP